MFTIYKVTFFLLNITILFHNYYVTYTPSFSKQFFNIYHLEIKTMEEIQEAGNGKINEENTNA